jgi:hypothetical protein
VKQFLSILIPLFALCTSADRLFAQAQIPSQHPSPRAGKATNVGENWTLLSDKDDLVFQARKGICDGRGRLLLNVQNKSGKEIQVFVSFSVQDGLRTPQQVLQLKPNQLVQIGCHPEVPIMPIQLRDGQEVLVNLEYRINKLFKQN